MAYKNKTGPTKISPAKFLAAIDNEQRRKDGREIMKLMREITGERAVMWGPSIIGFGRHTYRTESGHEGEMLNIGFSPRKANLVFYIGSVVRNSKLMNQLGKHKLSKGGCLYINKLDDVDRDILRQLIETSIAATRQRIAAQ